MPQAMFILLYISDDAASAVRGLVAEIKRCSGGAFNIVVIKATVDHDASGIKDTLQEEKVSLVF